MNTDNHSDHTKKFISRQEAIENIRILGRVFVTALEVVAKKPIATSDLMNGLVAYDQLGLKGQWDWMDESVDIVLRVVYDGVLEQLENDNIKIGH